MKRMKKVVALVIAVSVICAMSITAFAGSNSIKVTNAQNGENYTAYKMFDLSVNDARDAYSYKVNSEWSAFFTEGAGKAFVDFNNGYVTIKDGKATELAAAAAAAVSGKTKAAGPVTAANKAATLSGLDNGYFLIVSSAGTTAMTQTTPQKSAVTIQEKNTEPTVKKTIPDAYKDAQIGEAIPFTATVNIQKGAKNVVYHDTMTANLGFNASSLKVNGNAIDASMCELKTTGLTNETFQIVFKQSYLNTITAATDFVITYTATLNSGAVSAKSENNKAKVTWGQNNKSEEVIVTINTHKFQVLKYAAKDTTKALLPGAVFQLQDSNGKLVKLIKVSDTNYRVAMPNESGAVDTFTTVAGGNIVIDGVDNVKYQLEEIEAPAGFNKLASKVDVTVNAANTLVVEVPNNTGAVLPSTGGIGTAIFYALGLVLIALAGVVLVSRRRNSEK